LKNRRSAEKRFRTVAGFAARSSRRKIRNSSTCRLSMSVASSGYRRLARKSWNSVAASR
jgi:hypothetical protein